MNAQSSRASYWPEIERYFDELPSHLFRQGRLLQVNLAAAYSDTGQFKDILRRGLDYPWLTLPAWLLQDWGLPAGERRALIEKHTILAAFFSFTAAFLQQAILDEGSFFDTAYAFLQQSLWQEADRHFAYLFPAGSSFWDYHRAFWREHAEASLAEIERQAGKTVSLDVEPLLQVAQKLSPSKIVAAAVVLKAGREADLPQLFALLDRFNVAWQIVHEVRNSRRDVMRGRVTYPIAWTMEAAGIVPGSAARPEQVLGAMVLTGAVRQVCQECLTRLDGCQEAAGALGLPTVAAHLVAVQQIVQGVADLFSTELFLDPLAKARDVRGVFTPYLDPLAKACEMAEGYLLSDLTFEESWEVHRRGMFDADEVVSKMPAGLVIEVLCQHGHDMAEPIDAFYRTCQEAQFRYYEHPSSTPDTDTLGVLLRLYCYSSQKDAHAEILATPLQWLADDVPASRRIPVWLNAHMPSDKGGLHILHFGEDCGVVEAHVLLGLIAYDWESYQYLVHKSATGLLRRFTQQGYGVTVNYPPLYALVVMLRLITALSACPVQPPLERCVEEASERLMAELGREVVRPYLTPQDAAFLTLACLHPLTESLFNPRWITVLLKHQRSDGSWQGEPFFFVPNRGEVLTWYSSHTMTTAFCYHALRTYAEVKKDSDLGVP